MRNNLKGIRVPGTDHFQSQVPGIEVLINEKGGEPDSPEKNH